MPKYNSIQVALFYPWLSIRPVDLFNKLNIELDSLFNNTPTILPGYNQLPANAHFLTSPSATGDYEIRIAKNRIDLYFFDKSMNEINEEKNSEIKGIMIKFISFIINKLQIPRIGLISTFIIPNEQPVEFISEKLLKIEPNNLVEVSMRKNERTQYSSLELNNISVVTSKTKDVNSARFNHILISNDINNVPDNDNINDNIIPFFKFYFDTSLSYDFEEVPEWATTMSFPNILTA